MSVIVTAHITVERDLLCWTGKRFNRIDITYKARAHHSCLMPELKAWVHDATPKEIMHRIDFNQSMPGAGYSLRCHEHYGKGYVNTADFVEAAHARNVFVRCFRELSSVKESLSLGQYLQQLFSLVGVNVDTIIVRQGGQFKEFHRATDSQSWVDVINSQLDQMMAKPEGKAA